MVGMSRSEMVSAGGTAAVAAATATSAVTTTATSGGGIGTGMDNGFDQEHTGQGCTNLGQSDRGLSDSGIVFSLCGITAGFQHQEVDQDGSA